MALLIAAFAAGGLLLSQVAYRGGLGAPLAMVTLSNPVAAAIIGVTLLGERLQGGISGDPARGGGGDARGPGGPAPHAYVAGDTRDAGDRPQPSLIAAERRPELTSRPTETGPIATLPDFQSLPPIPVLPGTVVVLPSVPTQPEPAPGALQAS